MSPPSVIIVTIVDAGGVLTVKYGARLELTCLDKGVAAPLVSWIRRGETVVDTDTETGTLV